MMKRSEMNASIKQAMEFFEKMNFVLPEFANWEPEKWYELGHEVDEIRDCMLGWDVTDFGSSDFPNIGRTIFTLRNGRHGNERYRKVYAEKIMYNPEGQRAPLHFHKSKMEDIINRGGGNVLILLQMAGGDNMPCDDNVIVTVSGKRMEVPSKTILRIKPGESICLPPRTYHQFWGEEGTGPSMGGEVSSVCDDRADNFFLEDFERFPPIIEDEPRFRMLVHEYPKAKD